MSNVLYAPTIELTSANPTDVAEAGTRWDADTRAWIERWNTEDAAKAAERGEAFEPHPLSTDSLAPERHPNGILKYVGGKTYRPTAQELALRYTGLDINELAAACHEDAYWELVEDIAADPRVSRASAIKTADSLYPAPTFLESLGFHTTDDRTPKAGRRTPLKSGRDEDIYWEHVGELAATYAGDLAVDPDDAVARAMTEADHFFAEKSLPSSKSLRYRSSRLAQKIGDRLGRFKPVAWAQYATGESQRWFSGLSRNKKIAVAALGVAAAAAFVGYIEVTTAPSETPFNHLIESVMEEPGR